MLRTIDSRWPSVQKRHEPKAVQVVLVAVGDDCLADTRAGELLGNAAATARELLTVLSVRPRALGTDQPTDEPSTRHWFHGFEFP
jgi:hypothetical protein